MFNEKSFKPVTVAIWSFGVVGLGAFSVPWIGLLHFKATQA